MQTIHDVLRNRLLTCVESQNKIKDIHTLRESQWSDHFEELMRNRLVMGAFRYGTIEDAKNRGFVYKYIESAITRLQMYIQSGNQEHLVDAANLCMIEFLIPGSHENPYFSASDDGIHTERK